MKKALSILLILVMVFSFVSCGAKKVSTVEGAIDKYFADVKKDIGKFWESESYAVDTIGMSKDSYKKLCGYIKEFDYKIVDMVEANDKTTVNVHIENYDIGSTFYKALLIYAGEYQVDPATADFDVTLQKRLALMEKDYERDVTFVVTKSGDTFKVTEPFDIVDAVTGGMVSTLEEIAG